MFSSSDIQSRLKVLKGRRENLTEHVDGVSVWWLAILIFFILGIGVVAVWSYIRFAYWSDIDARLSEYKGEPAYDEEKFSAIMEKFASKSERSAVIISELPVALATTSTTAVE